MSWDRLDSRQVCARNKYGDLEPLGRIYRYPWDGGVVYGVHVYGTDEQPAGTFRTIGDARSFVLANAVWL